jgi:hypothetical protein
MRGPGIGIVIAAERDDLSRRVVGNKLGVIAPVPVIPRVTVIRP